MNKTQTDFIYTLGIGIFAYFSLLNICKILELITQDILIITKSTSKLIIFLPHIVSIIAFTIILFLYIKKLNVFAEIDKRKTLIKCILVFSVITITYALFVGFGTSTLMQYFSAEFDLYYDGLKEIYELKSYSLFIPILQYFILAIALLSRRKTVANNGYN